MLVISACIIDVHPAKESLYRARMLKAEGGVLQDTGRIRGKESRGDIQQSKAEEKGAGGGVDEEGKEAL